MSYLFEGDTIKLNEKDFNKALRLYQNINLTAELEQLDVELNGTKKWWPVMHAKLNYRNKVSKPKSPAVHSGNVAYLNNGRSTRDMTIEDEFNRDWAD